MDNKAFRKCIVVGIMILFIGASVLPVMSGATQNSLLMRNPLIITASHPHRPLQKGNDISSNNPKVPPERNQSRCPLPKITSDKKTLTEQKPQRRDGLNSKTTVNPSIVSLLNEISINKNKKITTPLASSITQSSVFKDTIKSVSPQTTNGDPRIGIQKNGGPRPLDGYTVHDITSGNGFNNIQAAIDDETTQNGDLITVDPGTYHGSINITKQITLRSNNSDSIIDAQGWEDGIVILANNVTLYGLNVTNGSLGGIYSPGYSGFTILNNTFWYNPHGFAYVDTLLPLKNYHIYQNTIQDNIFFITSNYSGILVYLSFDYNYASSQTLTMNNLIITNNIMHLSGTNTTGVDLLQDGGLFIDHVNDSTITLGTINISENVILGGKYGIGFMGRFSDLSNVQVTTGDLLFNNNTLAGQSGAGIACLPYSGLGWHGTTHGVFGKTSAQGNNIMVGDPQAIGIGIVYGSMYTSGFYNYTGTAHAQTEDILIQNNSIMSNGGGIFLWMDSVGGNNETQGLYDHAIVSTGNFIITHNVVEANNNSAIILVVNNCGVYLYNYASVTLGSFFIKDNDVSGNGDGIDIGLWPMLPGFAGLGYGMHDHSTFTMGTVDLSENTINVNGNGLGVDCVDIGENMQDYASCTLHAILMTNNTINAGIEGIVIDMSNFGYNISGHTTFSMSDISFMGNIIHVEGTGQYGDGIALDYIGDFGEKMRNYASFNMGSITVDANNITTSINSTEYGDAIYAYIDEFGYDMYNNTVFTMSDITFNNNTLSVQGVGEGGSGNGFYIDFIGDFGENMGDSASFTMGDIHMDSNNINTTLSAFSDGIYAEYSDFGEELENNAVVHMGDITFNSNVIRTNETNGYGLELYDFDWFGNDMYNNSIFTMGDLQINNNTIDSFDQGIILGYYYGEGEGWLGWFGVYMSDDAQATFGNVEVNDNQITNINSDGIYAYYSYFGSYIEGSATVTLGDIQFNGNNIISENGEGIDIEEITYFGYYISDDSVVTIGDILVNGNTITNNNEDGIYVYWMGDYGEEMSGTSLFTMGDVQFNSNIIETDDYGIDLEYALYDYGYDMYDSSVFHMGDFTCSDNNITSGNAGIYCDEFYGIGYYMGYDSEEDNANGACVFTMGDIILNHNNITSSDEYGIYADDIYEFGYDMYGRSSFTMGDIQFNDNDITAYDEGIEVDYLYEFGYDMYETSSFTMGDITFNGNTITSSDYEGIYLYEMYDFGYEMEGNAMFTMGDVQINDNVINSYDDGIYVYELSDFGEDTYNSTSVAMGNVTFNNNTITSDDGYGMNIGDDEEGIYDFGYELYDSSSFGMGNVQFNENNITSYDDGISCYIYYIGYDLSESSIFTMGDIQINDNQINSTAYGILIYWIGDIGEELYDDSQATIGSIEINNNYLNDSSGDGIDFWLGDIGSDLYDNATVTVKHITMNSNTVVSGDDGITDEWSGYIGEDVNDNAVYYGRGLVLAYNTIDTHNDGIRILGDYYGTDNLIVGANTILNAGQGIHVKQESYNITVVYNAMNGTENDGILFDSTYQSTILGNSINASQNKNGIELTDLSHNNTILRNTISNNSDTGINVTMSWNNTIYHNNILNNTLQAYDNTSGGNIWDNGYPSGGNYWSDYIGHDIFSGSNQNIAGSDGIGDTPYNITGYTPKDKDRYPFTHREVINHPSLYTPSDPSPANGATGISINTDTSWSGGDPDNDYDNYDVYFGTTNPPVYYDTVYFVQGSPISFKPATLTLDTTYYWQIVAWDAYNETASGPVWEFSTGTPAAPPSGAPPVPNHYAPTAVPGGPYNGNVNTPVQFDGSGSHTNGDGGTIIEYDWSFFVNDSFHNLGPTPTHTYTSAGTYKVSLRVLDSENGLGIDSTTATIRGVNTPPNTPTVDGPKTGDVNTAYTYSFTATDPDNNNVQYVIDWGDGTAKTTSSFSASGFSYTASHTWAASGTYSIKVYAEDSYGGISGTVTYYVTIGTPTSQPINGYLVDTNGDGIPDSWHNNVTGQTTQAQKQADGTYLVDTDGDGVYDHVYNPATGMYSPYSPAPPAGLPGWIIWGGAAAIIIILLILFFLLWRRRKKKKQKPLGYEYPAHEKGKLE